MQPALASAARGLQVKGRPTRALEAGGKSLKKEKEKGRLAARVVRIGLGARGGIWGLRANAVAYKGTVG